MHNSSVHKQSLASVLQEIDPTVCPTTTATSTTTTSSNSSLYDTKRKRRSPEKAEKLLFLKKTYLSLALNINYLNIY